MGFFDDVMTQGASSPAQAVAPPVVAGTNGVPRVMIYGNEASKPPSSQPGGNGGFFADVLAQPPQASVSPTVPDRSGVLPTIDAFGRGAADMLTFGLADELSAAGNAALNPVFGTGSEGETYAERYAKNLAAQRAIDQADTQQHPIVRVGGQLAGGILLPGAAADTLAGRAAVGAAAGGAYGFGSGQGVQDRLTNAATGAVLGGAAGVAAPYVASGAAAFGNKALDEASKIIGPLRGVLDPEKEAAIRIARAITRDMRTGETASPADLAAAQANSQPIAIADVGGTATRALGRSAANTSQEARGALERLTGNRFATQGERTASFLRSITRANGDHEGMIATLQEAARRANKPRYNAAYQAGDLQIWSPELERLSAAPSVQQALRAAVNKWRDWQVLDGFGASNPPVMVKNGILNLGNGRGLSVFPNLQFWDYAARNIADRAEQARRSGAMQEAARLGGLERQLKAELDRMVPQFKAARAGAADFFNAGDALEAGRNFVTANVGNAEARRVLAKMSIAERELFRQGFASELIRRVQEASDRRSVLNQIFLGASPAARERIEIALGADAAKQLETFLRVEHIMDMMRTALGNSTTARQLAELGIAGGYGFMTGDYRDAGAAYLLINGLRLGGRYIDQNVARRVGEMLASNDPRVLQRALRGASRNTKMMDAIRRAESKLTGLIGAGASGTAGPGAGDVARKFLTTQTGNADQKNKHFIGIIDAHKERQREQEESRLFRRLFYWRLDWLEQYSGSGCNSG